MFETLDIESLQQYWWLIIAFLGALLVMLMFVQGGQTLIWQLGKTEEEKRMVINSIGRKWDLTFTTLVTFGGAFFASFPLFYATSFSGAYWVWIIILFSFVVQAVSYEFRSKAGNFLGARTYEAFLLVNGIVGPILIGAAVGTFFTGSEFYVSEYNLSEWKHSGMGLEAALNGINLSLGLAVFFLSRVLGAQYLINNIAETFLHERCRKTLKMDAILFLMFFFGFLVPVLVKDGFALRDDGTIALESFKYLINLLQMPIVFLIFLGGVLLVLWGIFLSLFKNSIKGIWYTGAGTVLAVFSLFLVAGFNGTAYYPSTYDLQSSLTIYNSSSSHYTLTAMSYVSLFVPIVVAYIWYAWRSMDSKKLDMQEINSKEELY